MMICGKCSEVVQENNKYCPRCGAVLVPPAPATLGTVVPAYQLVAQVPVAITPKSNGLCVAGLVLGILAIVLFWVPVFGLILGVVGAVLSGVGIAVVKRPGEVQAGFGMALAGLIMSGLNLFLHLTFILAS